MSGYAQILVAQREWTPDQPMPDEYQREFLRTAVEEAPDMLVPERVPYGIWSHTAAPGCYKSAIAHQFETAIVDGTPLPGLDWQFAEHGDVLVISPDESFAEMQRRELTYTPFGKILSDGDAFTSLGSEELCTIHVRVPRGDTIEERIAWLHMTIADIEAGTGRKLLWIRWDTGAHLLGESDRNAYDQSKPFQPLGQRMAKERRVLFLPWHENKDGRTMGTVGIQAFSNCNTRTEMRPGDIEGKIIAGKVRGARSWSAAVRFDGGFAERIIDENPMVIGRTQQGSNSRRILEFLATGPSTPAGIETATGIKNPLIRMALLRAKRAGEVEKVGAQWQLVDNGGSAKAPDGVPTRWEENGKTYGVCDVCHGRMLVVDAGQTVHPNCDPDTEEQPAAPVLTLVPEPEEEPETPEEINGVRMLRESIESSRKHPMMRPPATERQTAPWSLMRETMRGEHRFRRPAPPDAVVTVLDRNGSYPSAMSNVPVASNRLRHTGPLEAVDNATAGIYLIDPVYWTEPGIGHPLGEIHGDDRLSSDGYWITTPHLRLLTKLQTAGRIDAISIRDSWTGACATNLFGLFSSDVQDARRRTAGNDEAYAAVKRTTSIAIRLLWPKGGRSPFWRPDWSLSVRAEASVRHWVRADQAVQAGATLVKLGSVDEAAFLTPDNVPFSGWAPAPYKIGTAYGEVKVKGLLTADEFNG